MRKIWFLLFTFLSIVVSNIAYSQNNDWGFWTSIGIEKNAGKWQFGTNTELRTINSLKQTYRWSLQLNSEYKLSKKIQMGLSYQFISFHDFKYSDYQPRNRISAIIQGKQKLSNFTFSLMEKVQITTKDETDRIKKSGAINTYNINPAWVWRNKIKVLYNIPKFPVNPACSFETFYQLNNPDGNILYKLRYTTALDYNISKHHSLQMFVLFDKEINVLNPNRLTIIGLNYVYTLPK